MRRGSTIQKMIAALAILVIFAGTQGFVISSHTCNGCGTHDETITLFATTAAENHDCQAEKAGSCCPTPGLETETGGECCAGAPSDENASMQGYIGSSTSCETISGGVCCEFDTERVAIETFTPEKTARVDLQVQVVVAEVTYRPISTVTPVTVNFDLHNKHGGGRDIVLLTCCLLI